MWGLVSGNVGVRYRIRVPCLHYCTLVESRDSKSSMMKCFMRLRHSFFEVGSGVMTMGYGLPPQSSGIRQDQRGENPP